MKSIRLIPIILLFSFLLSACGQAEPTPTPTPEPIPYTTPDWFDQAFLYEIFVRSYADSDGDGIGDLRGIEERLDYIASLHVDVLWLMPIYPSPSVHGYDVADFFAVNPDYGTLEDLQSLVAAAHAREMRVILDFTPSHLSNQNPLFEQAYSDPQSEISDWFVFTNKTNTQYAGFANSQSMPRFNHYNPEVVNYLIEAALFWMDLDGDGDYTDGVDGFRVDNATFPPQEFFLALRQAVKRANPEALLLGETWVPDARSLSLFYQDQFDALFDFPLYAMVQGSQNSNGDGIIAGKSFPTLIKTLLEEEAERYPPEAQAVRFFSNHDTNRIAAEVRGDLARQKLAASLLAALPGPVMLYYGEEIGMPGQKGTAPYWDNYRREPMDWFAGEEGPFQTSWFKVEDRWNAPDDGISVEEQENDPASLLNHYRTLFLLRGSIPALSEGGIAFLDIGGSNRAWGFVRYTEDQTLVALFNFGDEPAALTIWDFPITSGAVLDLLSGDFYANADGPIYEITLPPASAVWLSGE